MGGVKENKSAGGQWIERLNACLHLDNVFVVLLNGCVCLIFIFQTFDLV